MVRVSQHESLASEKGRAFRAVGCVVIFRESILLLRRSPGKHNPLTWGLPGGKVEDEEADFQAIRRELVEETGIEADPSALNHVMDFVVEDGDLTFDYGVYRFVCASAPTIIISESEHLNFTWAPFEDAISLNLVPGTRECLLACREFLRVEMQPCLFESIEHPFMDRISDIESLVEDQASSAPSIPATRIAIIGPPGAGKTSIAKRFVNKMPGWVVANRQFGKERSSRQFKYLSQYLSGDPRWAFICQIESLVNRYWQALDKSDGKVLYDEWIYSSLAYSRALRLERDLTEDEYQTFYFTYLALLRTLGSPDLTVFLRASPEVLRQRIVSRGRKMEQFSHSLPYLTRLVDAFDSVAKEVEAREPVITIETSNMSLANVLNAIVSQLVDYRITADGIG